MARRTAPLIPLVGGVGGALSVTTLVLVWGSAAGVDDFLAGNLANTWLAGLSTGAVALLIGWSRPGHRLSRVFGAASLTAAASAAATAYCNVAFTSEGSRPLADVAAWVGGVFWLPAFLLMLVAVPLLYPRGHLPSVRWRWPARVALLGGTVAIVGVAATDGIVRDVSLAARSPLPTPVPDHVLLPVAIAGFFVALAVGVAATVGVATRMRRLDAPERQQNAWFVAAVVSLLLVTWLPVPDVVGFLGNGAAVVALGIAIVRYHLFDIELVLSRALVYLVLTLAALGVYALAVLALGIRVGGGFWPAAVTAVAGLGLASLRGRLQRVVDRALYGARDDPLTALTVLGQRLGSAVATGDVLPAVAEAARRSLRTTYAAIELAGEDGPVCASGEPTDSVERFELEHAGEGFGDLVVGVRRGESHLSAADRRLVTAFARQAASRCTTPGSRGS